MEEIESTIKGFVSDYTCEKCGHTQKINVFPCINFNQNPEYYSLVKNLSIFKVKCEKCGEERIIQFESLFIDETHKYFIYLLTDKSLYNKFKYQITYFIETVLNKDDKYNLAEYKSRLVYSPNDLLEKINIFELGLDDEAIEIIKCGLYDKEIVDRSVYDTLFFDGVSEKGDVEFVAISSKTATKKPQKFVVQNKFYNKVIDDISNFKNRHHEYFEVIDEEWVKTKFS